MDDILQTIITGAPPLASWLVFLYLYLMERGRVRETRNQHIEDLREWCNLTKKADGN